MTAEPDVTAADVRQLKGGRRRVPRSRGALSGVLLVLLGLWAALIPFLGPYFHYAYTPQSGTAWHWTAARGWYEVLPGGVAVLGGLLLLMSTSRLLTSLGAWLAVAAGGWLAIAPELSTQLRLGHLGSPATVSLRRYTVEDLTYFTGLGALIVLVAAFAAGRLSVRGMRDVHAAIRRDEQAAAEERAAADEQVPPAEGPAAVPVAAASDTPGEAAPAAQDEPVATAGEPAAPYAPHGTTPVPDDVPASAEATPGGPAYPPAGGVSRPSQPWSPPVSPGSAAGDPRAAGEPDAGTVFAPGSGTGAPGGPAQPQRYSRGGGAHASDEQNPQLPMEQLREQHPGHEG